jgi:hypothetical protein
MQAIGRGEESVVMVSPSLPESAECAERLRYKITHWLLLLSYLLQRVWCL